MQSEKCKIKVLIISKPLSPPWNDGSKNLIKNMILSSPENVKYVIPVQKNTAGTFDAKAEQIEVSGDSDAIAHGLGSEIHRKLSILMMLFREKQADIAHFFFAPNLISSFGAKAGLFLKKRRSVHTVLSRPENFDRVKNLLFADIAVTTSEHTKRELLARGISNVRCVYPGVPLPGKIAGAEEKLQAKQKLGFGDAPVVLFGGDYETSEAIETLVRAIPRVLSKSKAMFVLACRLKTGNALLKKKQVENTLRKSGILSHVKFLDPVPSMEELYSASDIQLMHQEHYYAKIDIPLVLLEGFSFGIPAVMARGTPPEELMRFADAGIVVPPTDSEALAEAILNLISDREKYQKISDACRNLINERFNISIMTNSYIEIYKELLKI